MKYQKGSWDLVDTLMGKNNIEDCFPNYVPWITCSARG